MSDKTLGQSDLDAAVDEVMNELDAAGIEFAAASGVGSVAILGTGADLDVLVLIGTGSKESASNALAERGWFRSAVGKTDSDLFTSLRLGTKNALLTDDFSYYTGFLRAVEVSKFLKLKDKDARIRVHRIVRDGVTAAQAADLEAMPS